VELGGKDGAGADLANEDSPRDGPEDEWEPDSISCPPELADPARESLALESDLSLKPPRANASVERLIKASVRIEMFVVFIKSSFEPVLCEEAHPTFYF
jgi:hypothetical protein